MMTHIHKRKRDGVWTCGKCGWVIDDQEQPQKATCPMCPTLVKSQQSWTPIMVGDIVEKVLTSVGITQSVVEKLTRTEGKPAGCGCQGRKRWLNARGVEVQKRARDALLAVQQFYLGK